MKTSLITLFAVFCLCSSALQTLAKPPVRVLVYTRNGKGYVHKNIDASVKCLIKMGLEKGFAVDTTSDPEVFTRERLSVYKAVIFSNSNNEAFLTDGQRLCFMHYIQAGGGFVGIHSACGSERGWEWFGQMLGGFFLWHPPFEEYALVNIDTLHPANKALPKKWIKSDECYYFRQMNPDLHVLWAADTKTLNDTMPPDAFGRYYPAVWCHEFDGGRQWYTALGHEPSDYSDPLFVSHLWAGIKWILDNPRKLDYSKAYSRTITEYQR